MINQMALFSFITHKELCDPIAFAGEVPNECSKPTKGKYFIFKSVCPSGASLVAKKGATHNV